MVSANSRRQGGVGPSRYTAPGSSEALRGTPLLPASILGWGARGGLSAGRVHGTPSDMTGAAVASPLGGAAAAARSGGPYSGPYADKTIIGEPFAVWIGMFALLAMLGWFSNHGDTLGGANPGYIKVGGYNFLAVGVSSVLFIALLKILSNRFPFPGVTEFANAL